jgi:hypothetical protein
MSKTRKRADEEDLLTAEFWLLSYPLFDLLERVSRGASAA